MTYVIVHFDKNWADEFSVYGYKVMTVTEWENQLNYMLANKEAEVSFGFGTNEGWDQEPISQFISAYTVAYISEQTYQELMKLYNGHHGVFYGIDDYSDAIEGFDDEDNVDEAQEWGDYDKDC